MSLTLKTAPVNATAAAKKTAPKKRTAKKPFNPRPYIGTVFFFLAVAVLSISLPHLAEGFTKTLGVGTFAAGALAVLFDLSQVAAEAFLLLIVHGEKYRGAAGEAKVAKAVIGGATLVSIAYNGMAFLSHAEGAFGVGAALLLAVLLPVGVLALSYLGSRSLFGK